MRYQFRGKSLWGEWILGTLIQGETRTMIVPPSKIFSPSKWSDYKVDPNTVELLTDDDFETIPSKMNEE